MNSHNALMKKLLPLAWVALSACGDLPPDLQAPSDSAEPSAQIQPLTSETTAKASEASPATLRTGTDCGLVISTTDGEYVLSEIKQLEDINLSGCTYFAGNVRIAFKTPLVPTAQRYLFDLANIKEVTGRILQRDKGNTATTQIAMFTGLERAGQIDNQSLIGCPYPALKSTDLVITEVSDCAFPSLETVKDMYVQSRSVSGFNKLTTAESIYIHHSLPTIRGFKALTKVNKLMIYDDLVGGTVQGSFPVLGSIGELIINNDDVCGLSMPKLTTIVGNVQLKKNKCSFAPISTVVSIGGNLLLEEDPPFSSYETHNGLTALVSVGGNLTLRLDPQSISGYNALKTVGGTLSIVSRKSESLTGFKAVTSLGELSIDADKLSITGFQKLTTVNGPVSIKNNGSIAGFQLLSTLKGTLTLNTPGLGDLQFSKLAVLDGSLRYSNTGRDMPWSPFAALTEVKGDVETTNSTRGYDALVTVAGSLSILGVPKDPRGMRSIFGFTGVKTVGKDLILDRGAISFGPYGTQRLLDQLVGFKGKVILR